MLALMKILCKDIYLEIFWDESTTFDSQTPCEGHYVVWSLYMTPDINIYSRRGKTGAYSGYASMKRGISPQRQYITIYILPPLPNGQSTTWEYIHKTQGTIYTSLSWMFPALKGNALQIETLEDTIVSLHLLVCLLFCLKRINLKELFL